MDTKTQTQQPSNGTAQPAPTPAAPAAIVQRAPLAFLPSNIDDAYRIAKMLSVASILPPDLCGKPENTLLVLMMGNELGLSPVQSIRQIYVVKGKPYISSALKIALVRNSPECEYFICTDSSAESCTWETKRRGYPAASRFTFTLKDAERARLLNGGPDSNWQKWPTQMLQWRSGSFLAERDYSDIVGNIGTRDPGDPEPEDRGFLERVIPEGVTAPPPPLSVQVGLQPSPTSPPPDAAAKSSSPEHGAATPAAEVVPPAEAKPMQVVDAPLDPVEVDKARIKRALDACKTRKETQALIADVNSHSGEDKVELSRYYEAVAKRLPAK